MKHIDVFVTQYCYNLNNQVCVCGRGGVLGCVHAGRWGWAGLLEWCVDGLVGGVYNCTPYP